MNKEDERRKKAVIKALEKAKEKADTAYLYLTTNERNIEDIMDMNLAMEHIDIALEHLGAARKCRTCGCTEHNACPGGCSWVEEDLCSSCVGKEENTEAKVK